jgi:hypothetical protein
MTACVDVQVGAVHRQTGHALRRNADAGLARAAKTLFFLGQHHFAAPYFFLVSLIVIFSSE